MKRSELLQQVLSIFDGGNAWTKGVLYGAVPPDPTTHRSGGHALSEEEAKCYCVFGALHIVTARARGYNVSDVMQTGPTGRMEEDIAALVDNCLNPCVPTYGEIPARKDDMTEEGLHLRPSLVGYNDAVYTEWADMERLLTCAIQRAQTAEMEGADGQA